MKQDRSSVFGVHSAPTGTIESPELGRTEKKKHIEAQATHTDHVSEAPAHVSVRSLNKIFGDPSDAAAVVAVKDASFDVEKGEFVTLVGPSGCGKSTLLNMISGLEEPTTGDITVHGEVLKDRRGQFGYMFQKDLLLPWRKIVSNVALGLEVKGSDKKEARRGALELLTRFGLDEFADKYASQLSGGMRQRVALMRTLIVNTDCLLLDEPFGALDAMTRMVMQEWLLSIWESERRSVIFITHDIEEAIFLSDRVLTMSARPGRITGEFKINLPRPRSKEIHTSNEFIDLKKQVLDKIYNEVAM